MVFICQCMFSCLSTLKHAGVYMQEGDEVGETDFAISLVCPCGMRLHILQHIAEGWGNLLLSKIIGLLHPVISLIIMKASLQFSNYYSMPILFLSNKEEHRCKTKCQDSISCLCLRAIERWGTYTPSKYHPPIPHIKHLTTEHTQLPKLHAHCWHVQYSFSESNTEIILKEEIIDLLLNTQRSNWKILEVHKMYISLKMCKL